MKSRCQSLLPLKAVGKNSFLPLPASSDCQQFLAFLSLRQHNFCLCLCLHMIILLCVCVSAFSHGFVRTPVLGFKAHSNPIFLLNDLQIKATYCGSGWDWYFGQDLGRGHCFTQYTGLCSLVLVSTAYDSWIIFSVLNLEDRLIGAIPNSISRFALK